MPLSTQFARNTQRASVVHFMSMGSIDVIIKHLEQLDPIVDSDITNERILHWIDILKNRKDASSRGVERALVACENILYDRGVR